MNRTWYFIIAFVLIVAGFDIHDMIVYNQSISGNIFHGPRILSFILGFLGGHLVWGQKEDK